MWGAIARFLIATAEAAGWLSAGYLLNDIGDGLESTKQVVQGTKAGAQTFWQRVTDVNWWLKLFAIAGVLAAVWWWFFRKKKNKK